MQLSVPDMSTGYCKSVIEDTIACQDPRAKIIVDLISKTVQVKTVVKATIVLTGLKVAGYPAELIAA